MRFSGSPDEWSRKPWAYVLWCYYHLQELDRRLQWQQRMQRIELGELVAVAYNQPGELVRVRADGLAEAAAKRPLDEQRDRGLEMLRAMQKGHVLES